MKNSDHYIDISKVSSLCTGTGTVVFVTGWTKKELIAKKLDPSQYLTIGELYSPQIGGLDLLVRNLLANLDKISHVVLLGGTQADINSRSTSCVKTFMSRGVEWNKKTQNWKLKDGSMEGIEIGGDIEFNDLKKIRDLKCTMTWNQDTFIEFGLLKHQEVLNKPEYWGKILSSREPVSYPVKNTTSEIEVKPSEKYGQVIRGETIADVWLEIVNRIRKEGQVRPVENGHWQELIDLVAIVENESSDFYFPDPNYLPFDRKFLEEYIQQIVTNTPIEGVRYTYGQRLRTWFDRDQVQQVIDKLVGEPDAASGVMSIWDAGGRAEAGGKSDHEKGSSPCLNHIWCRIDADLKFSMTATFRSNDMYGAWAMNAMGLRALQVHIFQGIVDKLKEKDPKLAQNLKLGNFITISQSAHIYSSCIKQIDTLLKDYYNPTHSFFIDPIGYFTIQQIEVEKTTDRIIEVEVIVKQFTPSGQFVKQYQTTTKRGTRRLERKILADNPTITAEHAMYLGRELQRASHPNYFQA